MQLVPIVAQKARRFDARLPHIQDNSYWTCVVHNGAAKMSTPKTTITIGLLWHSFSSDNLGVGALSESQIAICEAAAEQAGVNVRFIVFGTTGTRNYTPAGKAIENGPPISFRELLTGQSQYLRDLARCDLVLDIGEGDSFTDIYGLRRFRLHIASKLAVLLKGIPLILSPQTVGPFDRWYARLLARFVMKRCAKVFARDGISFDYLKSQGLKNSGIAEAIDVAFCLPYRVSERPVGEHNVRIGLNVSGLLYSGGYAGENQFGLSLDYPRLMRELLAEWCKDEKNEVWLIPHVLSDAVPRDDDRTALRELAKVFPQARMAPEFASPSEAKSFIATMDFMTGARMHACIAAFSAGVPVVPFAYSRKFNGLFESLGYSWYVDGKSLKNGEAKDRILEGFCRREELAHLIRGCKSTIENRLETYQQVLITEMQRIGHGQLQR
jgi:polysaccharide pyruvyl transferase WcaK-like protein